MSYTAVSVHPEFGLNYKAGYVGFTFTDDSFISEGIAWFTRWEKGKNSELPAIDLSHVILVTGENECIEATTPKVKKTKLDEYFYNPKVHVCFRKPIGLNEEIAQRLIATGETKLGLRYDYALIVGHFLTNNVVGRLFTKILGSKFSQFVTSTFNNKKAFICSEYIAWDMNEQPEYRSKGILRKKPSDIDPQELFQDMVIFSPWSTEVKGTFFTGK